MVIYLSGICFLLPAPNLPIQAPPILAFCVHQPFRYCTLIQGSLCGRITLNYFEIALQLFARLHLNPPRQSQVTRGTVRQSSALYCSSPPAARRDNENGPTNPNFIFYLSRLTSRDDLFQLWCVCVWDNSKTLPLHIGFQVENLPERRSSDDDFRVQVARFQLHQFGEIRGRTDQNATHAHNLKG